jgi:hypothetical protein
VFLNRARANYSQYCGLGRSFPVTRGLRWSTKRRDRSCKRKILSSESFKGAWGSSVGAVRRDPPHSDGSRGKCGTTEGISVNCSFLIFCWDFWHCADDTIECGWTEQWSNSSQAHFYPPRSGLRRIPRPVYTSWDRAIHLSRQKLSHKFWPSSLSKWPTSSHRPSSDRTIEGSSIVPSITTYLKLFYWIFHQV